MVNFVEYKDHFSKKVKWCENQIRHLRDNFQSAYVDPICRISEYKRDCHIIIRHLELLLKKYPDLKIPNEVYDVTKTMCMYTRFFRLEQLEDYLISQKIKIT